MVARSAPDGCGYAEGKRKTQWLRGGAPHKPAVVTA
jgi:hypothetical protein